MSAKSIAAFERHMTERATTIPCGPPEVDQAVAFREEFKRMYTRHKAHQRAAEACLSRALECQAMAELLESGTEKLK